MENDNTEVAEPVEAEVYNLDKYRILRNKAASRYRQCEEGIDTTTNESDD